MFGEFCINVSVNKTLSFKFKFIFVFEDKKKHGKQEINKNSIETKFFFVDLWDSIRLLSFCPYLHQITS